VYVQDREDEYRVRVSDLKNLSAGIDKALSASGPFILEIDMRSIGSFKTAFAGPPVKAPTTAAA